MTAIDSHSKIDIFLGVNVDHIATLRQARGERYPDPVHAALLAEDAGADGITAHLREDRRHISDRDIRLFSEVLQTRLNLEMAMTDEMLGMAESLGPSACCLVPEKREELTTEGGLDVHGQSERARGACARLAAAGIEVSLFIDPDPRQIEAAAHAGAPVVELHTGHYAKAATAEARQAELERLAEGIRIGRAAGLGVNAGHGLHYHNVQAVAALAGVRELNIGHSIVSRALFVGFPEAVREMKRLMRESRPSS